MSVVLAFVRVPDRQLELRQLIVGEIPVNVEMYEDDLTLQDRMQLARDTADAEA